MPRKVCVVTGSRAEYGLLYPILKEIKQHENLNLQLIATTMHLSDEFGLTYKQIEKDGFKIDIKINNLVESDSITSMAKTSSNAMRLLSDGFEKLEPNVVLLLGDRYETHAAASTALLMNIPIAHVHGGEVSQGAVDEQIRHSITKMSYLHFCSTDSYRNRIIQMGEDPTRVFNCGAPGIDNISKLQLISKDQLEKKLSWKFGSISALFTYHPETLAETDIESDLDLIFKILDALDMRVLFTYSNADFGGRVINQNIEHFCKKNSIKYKAVKSLGQVNYLSAMKHVDLIIGNSSSGIIEAASFKKPVINIGDRQKGRVRGINVIDCTINSLMESIMLGLSNDYQNKIKNINNLYGSGNAASFIVEKLNNQTLSVVKEFIDQ